MTANRMAVPARSAIAILLAAAIVCTAGVAEGRAQTFTAVLHHADVTPAQINLLRGDEVVWRNASFRNHTVTSAAGGFDSGLVQPGRTFTHLFDADGSFPYACKLHPSVQGRVDVYPVLLTEGQRKLGGGSVATLEGRALPNAGPVSIEADRGSGFVQVATVGPAPDGSFTADVPLDAPTTYRAVVAAGTGPGLKVDLAPPQDLRLSAKARRGRLALDVRATTSPKGSLIVLQAYLRERFGWWTIRRAKLGPDQGARFRLGRTRVRRLRALVVGPDGFTATATSNELRLKHRH
jgi:plastocyanin